MAVFYDGVGTGAQFYSPHVTLIPFTFSWKHTVRGSEVAAVAVISYLIGQQSSLSGVTRKVTFGGVDMVSLGSVQWGTDTVWTEFFGLLNPPKGTSTVKASVLGGAAFSKRIGRGNSVAYSGVSAFGTLTTATGTTSSMTVSSNAPAASVAVGAFSALNAGISTFNRNTRYLNSVNMSLAMGDVDGSGTAQAFTAARAGTGSWGGGSLVLTAADVVATAKPVVVDTATSAAGARYPRFPGFTRRSVFAVTPEK